MKFVHYLEKIGGVEIYPIVSLTVFFLFFAIMFAIVMKMKKEKVDEISRIPLD